MAIIPTAAAEAVARLIDGPPRDAHVVASTTDALFVEAGDGLLCVAGPHAVRLPCALVAATPPPRLTCGTRARVGSGRLDLPSGASFRAARWWRVPRPRLRSPLAAAALLPASDVLLADEPLPLPLPLPHPLPPSVQKRPTAGALAPTVAALLGLGPGLTPAGDDVLTGMLVTLTAAGSPAARRLATAIEAADPPRRTTAVSAALLRHAAHGECAPPLADLLTAVDEGEDPTEPIRRLRGVGHSSGAALLAGVRQALDLVVELHIDRQECA